MKAMAVYVGTSGYNYPEWRGSFYPEKFPAAKMLAYYAGRFNTVEVNYTFYRMPTAAQLETWARTTPDGFRFTLKAPRRITHDAKLQRCEELARGFCQVAATLGPKLGVLLFQLPPTFKRDDGVLGDFLDLLPDGTRAAFEFRHASWHDDAVFDRLRDEGYQPADIARWAGQIRDVAGPRDAYVYFKHEEQGKGPEFANLLIAAMDSEAARP
jgi:uncharacterized protein YecE (DUF72 family)